MKKSFVSFFATCAIALFMVGCGSEEKVDSAQLKSQFGSASGEIKDAADKAISAIDSQNMSAAIQALGTLIAHSNDLSQAQLDAAQQAFVSVNVIAFDKGNAESEAKSQADKDALEAQAKGSE